MTTNKILYNHKKNIFSKENISSVCLSAAIVLIMIALLANPKKYNASVLDGISMFATCVLPGLFPFMLLTKLLTNIGAVQKMSKFFQKPISKIFGTNGIASYVMLMSMVSGYPIGAKMISDLYVSGQITENDAKKMIAFCTTSGPIFVVGTVGAIMFGNIKIGIIIYVSHILSSIMCGIILRGKSNKQQLNATVITYPTAHKQTLGEIMHNTVESILVVGGYITIFFLLADILVQTHILPLISAPLEQIFSWLGLKNISSGLLSGILEVTRGAKLLSCQTNIWSVCFASALVSFSGLSIIMQSMAFLSKCKIKARYFIFVKCVHAIICFALCFALCKIFIF